MNEITIKVGKQLFSFASFTNWCNTAKRKFRKAGVSSLDTVCVDAKGRLCTSGKEFTRAEREDTFPVTVYAAIEEEM